MTELLDKLQSRGHWYVAIRPVMFVEERVPNLLDLPRILERTSVHLRGWDFPHIDTRNEMQRQPDHVEQLFEWDMYLEAFRFFKSGQFIHFSGMTADWLDQSALSKAPDGWQPGQTLRVPSAVFKLTEIFEFAARLAITDAGGEAMNIEIGVRNIAGRVLSMKSQNRLGFGREQRADAAEYPYEILLETKDLVSSPRSHALNPATELFRLFGWDPSPEVLKGIQDELYSFRRGT